MNTLRTVTTLAGAILLFTVCDTFAQTLLQNTATGLVGTSWQLVKFQNGDDTTITPDEGAKYTIAFNTGGTLIAHIDCNQGRGTWKLSGAGQLELGPLALTRIMYPPGSLHDRIVRHWPYIRSYIIKNEHFFISLMADGGIYEFEPMQESR